MSKRNKNFRLENDPAGWFEQGLKGLLTLPLAAAGGWILYSHLVINHNQDLPEALPGERKVFFSPDAGQISFYTTPAAQGRPLVLIHSINAAASAFEMRPIYLRYHNQRPVFALDLPGFGFSERSKREYSPALYVNTILDFLTTQIQGPADVVALSLGCEFAAQAALARPDLFSSLIMISPSGFNRKKGGRASQKAGRSGSSNLLYPLFAFPVWARPLFDLLSTRASIEYFLKQSFIGPPPPDLLEYDYLTAHRPGAEHAPLYFVTGKLFTKAVRQEVYERLQVPSLVLHDRDNFVNFDMLPDAQEKNSNLQSVRLVPSLGLPHFEDIEATTGVFDHFWG